MDDVDVFACSLTKLQSLEITGDTNHTNLVQEKLRDKFDGERILLSAQKYLFILLGGLRAPLLSKLICQVSFFDVENEKLAINYSNLMLAWIYMHLRTLSDFRFVLSWKPGCLGFVESLVCVNTFDEKTIEVARRLKTIRKDTIEEYNQPVVSAVDGRRKHNEDGTNKLERLKLIWDFTTPAQTRNWLSLLKIQRKLKCIGTGFIHPVMWDCYSQALIQCSPTLSYVSIHNLAVWDGEYFSAVDLKVFENCVSLKALHMSLSVFERAILPRDLEKEPQIINVLSLPKGLAELSLIRFTLRTDQIISTVASLPSLKKLRMAFLTRRDEPELGITPVSFRLIWNMIKLQADMWYKDFVPEIKPIVNNMLEYLEAEEDVVAFEELKNSFDVAASESGTFEFSMINSAAAASNETYTTMQF